MMKKFVVITINNSVKKYCKAIGLSYISVPTPQISMRILNKTYESKRKIGSFIKNSYINQKDIKRQGLSRLFLI